MSAAGGTRRPPRHLERHLTTPGCLFEINAQGRPQVGTALGWCVRCASAGCARAAHAGKDLLEDISKTSPAPSGELTAPKLAEEVFGIETTRKPGSAR